MKIKLLLLVVSILALTAVSCSPRKHATASQPEYVPGSYNELGKVFVAEYHRMGDKDGEFLRDRKKFRADLQTYYDLGFRLVSVKDFFNKGIVNVPSGKKPLIMTFDDGHPSQFSWLIVNGTTVEGKDGFPKVDPNCAVGILDEFCNKHHDFGRSVTFFCNSQPFYQPQCPKLWKLKLQYLVKTGREIGNHTFDHGNLAKLDFATIRKELALEQAKIEEALPSYEASSVALPFGGIPKTGKWLLQKGSYNGKSYNYKVSFLVGSSPTLPPWHKDFDPALVQRIQADDTQLGIWFADLKKHPERYFVSDGDPNTITIRESDAKLLDKTALQPGTKIRFCIGKGTVKEQKVEKKTQKSGKLRIADKGVYYTFHSAGMSSRIDSILENYPKCGLNTLVIDMKDVEGTLGADLDVPLAKKIGANERIFIKDLKGLVAKLHKSGIRVSARIAVFKDHLLAHKRPDLALKTASGGTWHDKHGINWVNPFSPEVRNYDLDIAEAAARSGVDEVQFDYIRFPEKGHTGEYVIPANKDKYDAIETFLKEADERLDPYNVSIAIDVFGVMAWEKDVDIAITGQRLWEMAKYVYAICPMLYPSHFDKGFNGHKNPADEPYLFIKEGCLKTAEMIKGTDAKIVPWIQGFNYRVPGFNENYVIQQKKGAHDAGIDSFLVWNAGNNYTVTYSALSKK